MSHAERLEKARELAESMGCDFAALTPAQRTLWVQFAATQA